MLILIPSLIALTRDDMYAAIMVEAAVKKATRLALLHQSTRVRRQLARERNWDRDEDPDSDAETDKYDHVSIVEFKAINTYRTSAKFV